MTLSPILPAREATTVALDFGVFLAEQARTHRVSQTAIIAALRPCITPSQPEAPSKPHAPAADTPATQAAGDTTDGEETPRPSSPSVNPDTSAVTADEEQARHEPVDEWATPPEHVDPVVASSLPGAECAADRAPIPKPPRKETGRAKILATHAEHPDWPSKLIAEHLGISEDAVRATASRKNIKLVSWWDYERALKAQKRKELAAAVEKPPEAAEPPAEPQAEAPPDLPPVSLPSERLPPPSPKPAKPSAAIKADTPKPLTAITVPNEPLRPIPTHAPRGAGKSVRFYVRDAAGRYVHQSLDPSPTDTGPLMTLKRLYAWFPTDSQFKAAQARWPELAGMRQEGAQP